MNRAIAWAFVVTIFTSMPARADIYGYIDAAGVTHLATEKLDEQYTLFLKVNDDPAAPRDEASNSASNDALMKTRLFKRLVDHPNIARYEPMIRAAATRHGLDPQLVKAVVAVESGFEPRAVSEKGAVGLMQVLPATGERYGVRADRKKTIDQKLADPTVNLEIGTRYLADLRKMFASRPELALAAYNAGENAVIRFRNAIPPFPETQAYVKLVDQFHAFYSPQRATKTVDGNRRLRVTIAARRNLPDPNMPMRLPAPAASIAIPAAASPLPTGGPHLSPPPEGEGARLQ
ncbi:MAG: lytic transglycosylase domain-containing protein [Burkholderiaceae bacterium]